MPVDLEDLIKVAADPGEPRPNLRAIRRRAGQLRRRELAVWTSLTLIATTATVVLVASLANGPSSPQIAAGSKAHFTATSTLTISNAHDIDVDPQPGSVTTDRDAERIFSTFESILESRFVARRAIAITGVDRKPAAVARGVEARHEEGTDRIQISVSDPERSAAIAMANAVGNAFIEMYTGPGFVSDDPIGLRPASKATRTGRSTGAAPTCTKPPRSSVERLEKLARDTISTSAQPFTLRHARQVKAPKGTTKTSARWFIAGRIEGGVSDGQLGAWLHVKIGPRTRSVFFAMNDAAERANSDLGWDLETNSWTVANPRPEAYVRVVACVPQ